MSTYRSSIDAAGVGKLLPTSDWYDISNEIVAAVAGAPFSDPDAQDGSLTASLSTGTFDGETVNCVNLGWTTHASTNDGYDECLVYSLGFLSDFFSDFVYDPTFHIIHLESILIDTGTLNGTVPIVAITLFSSASGGSQWSTGYRITSSTSIQYCDGFSSTSSIANTAFNPTTSLAQGISRRLPTGNVGAPFTSAAAMISGHGYPTPLIRVTSDDGAHANVADGEIRLCIGQATTTAAAISGLKIRFRIRFLENTNLRLMDFDWGVQK